LIQGLLFLYFKTGKVVKTSKIKKVTENLVLLNPCWENPYVELSRRRIS